MALSQFPAALNASVPAVIKAADAFRYLRDTTGDMTWRSINTGLETLRNARETSTLALSEANKSPVGAEAYLADLGGPQTLVAFQSGLVNINQKATAFTDVLALWVDTLPVSQVRSVGTVSYGGVSSVQVIDTPFVSVVYMDTLRASTELQDLIVAFEAIGA